jgi:hypothetical protein
MTDPFTGYLHPYYTYTWLIPLLVITSLLHIYMTGPFTGYLHPITHLHANKGISHVYV